MLAPGGAPALLAGFVFFGWSTAAVRGLHVAPHEGIEPWPEATPPQRRKTEAAFNLSDAAGDDFAAEAAFNLSDLVGDDIADDRDDQGDDTAWDTCDRAKHQPSGCVEVKIMGQPKSGTTWLEWIGRDLVNSSCAHIEGCYVREVGGRVLIAQTAKQPDAEQRSWVVSPHMKHRLPIVSVPADVRDGGSSFGASKPAPLVSDEALLRNAREHLNWAGRGRRWAVIFRDPRDVAISECYHMWKGCGQAERYLASRINNLAAWIDLRYRFFKALHSLAPERVLMIFYEDMRHDEKPWVERLATLWNLELLPGQAEGIVRRTSFESMSDMSVRDVPQGNAASGKVRNADICGFTHEIAPQVLSDVNPRMFKLLSEDLQVKWHLRC